MTIDASLFAHIHNDAFLSGTVKLQGNFFKNTISYLSAYCERQKRAGRPVSPSYFRLFEKLSYLQQTEQELRNCTVDAQTQPLAAMIADDLEHLISARDILIPGGWSNANGGHAMVYQFSRGSDGYIFTVFNAGAGLQYHSKKSIQDRELYNPRKMWSIPFPKNSKEKKELENFISRLLKARVMRSVYNPKKSANEDVLYKEIFPSISYVHGQEINADEGLPDHAYTGGQLSGTCTQRAIHQMLKINSDTLDSYQHFILEFKMDSLQEYVDACLNGSQPFNNAVADQINLAISNSLKILNIPGRFTPEEIEQHKKRLIEIKNSVVRALPAPIRSENNTEEPTFSLTISNNQLDGVTQNIVDLVSSSPVPKIIDEYKSLSLLQRLRSTISAIENESDPTVKYTYLEQLILFLPLTDDGKFTADAYKSLKNVGDYQAFLAEMNTLQEVLNNLRGAWLQKAQIPLFNHLCLSVLSLQIDAYEATIAFSKPKKGGLALPSYAPFGNIIMQTLIAKRERNPFEATNNAYADQRICSLKKRFQEISPAISAKQVMAYYQGIMNTEPELNSQLFDLYQKTYGLNVSKEHQVIRECKVESLFMIISHLDQKHTLGKQFKPLIDKLQAHYFQESKLRQAINPYFNYHKAFDKPLNFDPNSKEIVSPLYIGSLRYESMMTTTTDKYNLGDSAAREALERDASEVDAWKRKDVSFETANAIQLKRHKEERQQITTPDVVARDYYHLRGNPAMQIALTLDYFTLRTSKLSDPNDQRYVEANLFQPGLLADALTKEGFISQFDNFLKTGKRYFAQQGCHTRESLLFFRLDLLVSRYYAQLHPLEGSKRLHMMQEDLAKQLSLVSDPDVVYVLQQYLFLATVACIEGGDTSTELLDQAMRSYFYINKYANPLILEDAAHSTEVEAATGKLKLFASQQPEERLREGVKSALLSLGVSLEQGFTGKFPNYSLVMKSGTELKVNALKGLILEEGLVGRSLPLAIQRHPLVKQLGLHDLTTCLANVDNTYFIIRNKEGNVHLFYKNDKLTIEKDWTIDGETARYQLQALTQQHESYYANESMGSINTDLPSILTDGTMNYWKNVNSSDTTQGLLVRNQVPTYAHINDQIIPIQERRLNRRFPLVTLTLDEMMAFNSFESNHFIIAHGDTKQTLVQLPRYGLHFQIDKKTRMITHEGTGEQLIDNVSPIHQSVASLVLQGKEQRRVLVPKMRFYGVEDGVVSDFHPVVHDKNNVIAQGIVDDICKKEHLSKKPLWDFQNNEQYVSFQLINNEPVADSSADALYLAYTYLVTNQSEKAWKILDECTKRLGGLKGDPDELKYIQWICNDLPYLLNDNNDSTRGTPPFVACKLKAMSLLSDYLQQDGTFDLNAPDVSKGDANALYAKYQFEETTRFLKQLPETIYNTFSQFQTMGRYLEHQYQLSKLERKRLLDYYHQSLPPEHKPLGALGYQWTLLSLEAVMEEKNALIAQKKIGELSRSERKRLADTDEELKKIKQIAAKSTQLELIAIDLSLPNDFQIKPLALKRIHKNSVTDVLMDRDAIKSQKRLKQAVKLLSSTISDDDFIEYFPLYLHIAATHNDELSKALLDFCTHTLIAQRHVPFNAQSSHIPFLCNVLYRAAHNQEKIKINNYYLFSSLVTEVKDYRVPPLQVYQAKDVYSKILAAPEQLIAEYEHQIHKPISTTILPTQRLIEHMGIDKQLTIHFSPTKSSCDALIAAYQKIQDDLAEQLGNLGNEPSQGFDKEFAIEERAGKILITTETKRKELAKALLGDGVLLHALQQSANKSSTLLAGELDQLWAEALQIANQGPDDADLARTWAIEKESRARATLTKADLLSIYTKADQAYSVAKTGLSLGTVQKLHDAIHRALVKGICHQSAEKIKTKLHEAGTTADLNSAVTALDLLARSEIPALDIPAIVLLQHEEQILLHNRQVSALKELLASAEDDRGFNEVVEKIIMGGGKSKVILPILAEVKARGNNLVIVEVPQALLETNYEDLNRTSQRLYGKRAYRFDFNRNSNASPQRLEQIYKMFVEVMTNKNYLVTTGEAMQSLELKYIELLEKEGPIDAVCTQQIYWLDKITSLVRYHGDCIIDEAHQGLSIKKRLNYTGADTQPVRLDAIKNTVALFKLIDRKFIVEAPTLSSNYDWTQFKNELANKLLSDKKSPLYPFAELAEQKYGQKIKDELVIYLTNKADQPCLAVVNASPQEKEMLGFFKQQVGVLLQETLVRNLNENYGPSKRKGLNGIQQTLALPYAANNVVNEQNRFGNQLESLNYAAQMMLINGISQKLLVYKMEQWLIMARKELFHDMDLKHLDDTPTAKEFNILAAPLGLKLSDVDLKKSDQLKKLHAHFQHQPRLIFDILEEDALVQVQREGETFSSNSFNHVDMYRSTQAVSGTPSNHTTFHQRLKYNKTSSLGTDGYVIEVIRSKNTAIKNLDYQNVSQFIKGILTIPETLGTKTPKASEHTRAIIDVCATFQGVNNSTVAQEIAGFYRTVSNNTIRHVLYFDKNQVLCAIDINEPNKPIVLKTTDEKEISRLLNSTPDQRFTYYDQAHTVGTDITQGNKAQAKVLVDEKTLLQAFLQGSMRMRGLPFDGTIEIIVPERLRNIKYNELIQCFTKNDNLALLDDNLLAAKLQMNNLIRRQCLSIIRKIPSEEVAKKRELARIFKPFLVDKPSESFFELYGALHKKQAAADILKRHKEQLIANWHACLTLADIPFKVKDSERIAPELQGIIDTSLPHCLQEYDATENDSFGLEVQIQTQSQVQMTVELAIFREVFDSSLSEKKEVDLRSTEKIDLDNYSLSLNALCSSDTPTDLFSNQIRGSKNYAEVYLYQTKYTGGFLKPAWVTWYYMQEGQLQAMIITPQEVERLTEKIELLEGSWLSTSLDTVIGGKRPAGMLQNEHYLSLREQVRFFNGEIANLLTQNRFYWLKEKTTEKIDLFKRELMHSRPGSGIELPQLELLSKENKEGFTYIAYHRFEDLSQVDWKKIVPNRIPADVDEYSRVAAVFNHINQQWNKESLNINQLQRQFSLSLSALGYVQEHLELFSTRLDNIINYLVNPNEKSTFLSQLTPEEEKFLEEYFNMPLSEFTKQFAPAINLHALLLLRLHPTIKGKEMEKRLTQLILENPFCDESVLNTVISSSIAHNQANEVILLTTIANKWFSTQAAKKILEKASNNPKVLRTLLDTTLKRFSQENDENQQWKEIIISIKEVCKKNNQMSLFEKALKENNLSKQMQSQLLRLFDQEEPDKVLLSDTTPDSTKDKQQRLTGSGMVSSKEQMNELRNKANNSGPSGTTHHSTKDKQQRLTGSDVASSKEQMKELRSKEKSSVPSDTTHDATRKAQQQSNVPEVIHSKEQMKELLSQAKDSTQIARLLNHPEMTSSIADALSTNPHYNYRISNWGWLTEKQLLVVLEKTDDFDSLQCALNHKNLSKSERDKWLDALEVQYKNQDKNVIKQPQQQILYQLGLLRILACKHAMHGIKNPAYTDVARTAFNLYQTLHKESVTCFSQKNPDIARYQQNCNKAIDAAAPVLNTHRGFKQALLDILNVILAYITFSPPKEGTKWRFFQAKTASMEQVDDIENTIRKLDTNS